MEQEHLLQPHQVEIHENRRDDDNIAVRNPPVEEPVLYAQEPIASVQELMNEELVVGIDESIVVPAKEPEQERIIVPVKEPVQERMVLPVEESVQERIVVPVGEVSVEIPVQKRVRRTRRGGKNGKCCVCQTRNQILKLRPCSHRICKNCVRSIATRNCPTCRARIDTYLPPHLMGNERWEDGVTE